MVTCTAAVHSTMMELLTCIAGGVSVLLRIILHRKSITVLTQCHGGSSLLFII